MGDKAQFFSPEDLISLSLEYYQARLDTTDVDSKCDRLDAAPAPGDSDGSSGDRKPNVKTEKEDLTADGDSDGGRATIGGAENGDGDGNSCEKRFLQCPAAVSMRHLQKFIRMKFGLTGDHRVSFLLVFTRKCPGIT